VCVGYWWNQRHPEVRVKCEIVEDRIKESEPGEEDDDARHRRRSLFVLEQYRELLGECRFEYMLKQSPAAKFWSGIQKPVMNYPVAKRKDEPSAGSERALGKELCARWKTDSKFRKSFPIDSNSAPVELNEQFPVGLFDSEVATKNQWTPARGSQVDLWGASPDGNILHLFELKKDENTKAGIIPESLYYACLLAHVRSPAAEEKRPVVSWNDKSDGPKWAGAIAARRAKKTVMWLLAPSFHPLVYLNGRTPLEWLNPGLAKCGIELRVLHLRLDESKHAEGWGPSWPTP